MSDDVASSSEGATVIKHDMPMPDKPLHVRYTIQDEFVGPIDVEVSVTVEDAKCIAKLGDSVARLYFGHEYGVDIREALRGQLVRLGVQYS